jgi:hypothetical protein
MLATKAQGIQHRLPTKDPRNGIGFIYIGKYNSFDE